MATESYIAPPYTLLRPAAEELPLFHAIDPQSQQPCVIKFGSSKSPYLTERIDVFRERLEMEAEKLRRWRECPNVIRLLDARLEANPPFIVLEVLGACIDDKIPADGFPLPDCLVVTRDIAAALSAIHSLGEFHGDVKPDNILLNPATGCWTLIDPGGSDLTTTDYAPERVSGWERDILALGRTFITLYTGAWEEELDEFYRDGLELQGEGDRLLRLLDRMLWPHPGPERGRRARPSALTVLRTVRALLASLHER